MKNNFLVTKRMRLAYFMSGIFLCLCGAASAQVQMMARPYIEPKVVVAPVAPVATPVAVVNPPAVSSAAAGAVGAEVGGNTANMVASSINQGQIQAPTAEPVAPVAPVIAKPTLKWTVDLKDVYIANTLQRWATEAQSKGEHKWRVKWDASKHFVIDAPDTYTGTFEEAVTALLSTPGIQQGRYPLEVCFWPNTPPLARITLRGDQEKECK